jgi:hypothetical protein
VAVKRKIKAREVVNDIRNGLSNLQLMEKYQLSSKGLTSLFRKLIDAEAVMAGELNGRELRADDTVELDQQRGLTRNYVLVNLPVSEADKESEDGFVCDITERGLQVAKLEATVGARMKLALRPDYFSDIHPLRFEAVCRWVKPATEGAESLAGFEITDISPHGILDLKNLIRALTL